MNARFFGSGSQTLVEERCIEPKVATMKGKQDASLMITQMLHVGNIYQAISPWMWPFFTFHVL